MVNLTNISTLCGRKFFDSTDENSYATEHFIKRNIHCLLNLVGVLEFCFVIF